MAVSESQHYHATYGRLQFVCLFFVFGIHSIRFQTILSAGKLRPPSLEIQRTRRRSRRHVNKEVMTSAVASRQSSDTPQPTATSKQSHHFRRHHHHHHHHHRYHRYHRYHHNYHRTTEHPQQHRNSRQQSIGNRRRTTNGGDERRTATSPNVANKLSATNVRTNKRTNERTATTTLLLLQAGSSIIGQLYSTAALQAVARNCDSMSCEYVNA